MASELSNQLGEFPVTDNLIFRQESSVCSYSQREVEREATSDPRAADYVSVDPGKMNSGTEAHLGFPVGLGQPLSK